VYDTRKNITHTITANPVPSALIGIGIAWLWMNSRSTSYRGERDYGPRRRPTGRYYETDYDYNYDAAGTYPSRGGSDIGRQGGTGNWERDTGRGGGWTQRAGETVSGAVGRVQETAGNLASRARETVTGAVGQAQGTAGQWMGQARHQAHDAERRLQAGLNDSPLAFGAIALALGTAVGLTVPVTRKENEWMGEARDRLLDQAQTVAHDTIEQVQDVAQKVGSEMSGSRSGAQGSGSEGSA
jgi:uncharacterized protein YjbJ (UPF0337 family)